MGEKVVFLIVMAFLHKLFRNRRKFAIPVDDERRKSDVAKRAKQSWEWHMKAIEEQVEAAKEALKR